MDFHLLLHLVIHLFIKYLLSAFCSQLLGKQNWTVDNLRDELVGIKEDKVEDKDH